MKLLFKIKIIKPLLYLAFLILGMQTVNGQTYPFVEYSSEEGMSSPQALCIYQHTDHSLWIGTNDGGINIFEGSSFRKISVKDGLTDNTIYDIKRIQGKIFIGTNNGLTIIDENDQFHRYTRNEGLPHERVYSVFEDSKGNIWIGTEGGARLYKNSSFSIPEYAFVQSQRIFNIYEDTKGNVWFCTVLSGLIKLSPKGEVFQYFVSGTDMPHVTNFVADIHQLSDDKYLVASRQSLFLLEGDNLSPIFVNNLSNVSYFDIMLDSKKNIWISSDQGAFKVKSKDIKKGHNQFEPIESFVESSIKRIWKVYEDEDHFFWFIDIDKGLAKLVNENIQIYDHRQGLPKVDVNWIYDVRDSIFIGTKEGLFYIKDNYVNRVDLRKNLISAKMDGREIRGGFMDLDSTMWLASNSGLIHYSQNKTEVFLPDDYEGGGLLLSKTWTTFKDSEGTLWIGTAGGIAILKNGKLVRWSKNKATSIPTYNIFEYRKEIYFATERGVVKHNLKTKAISFIREEEGLTNQKVNNIISNKYGLWFATDDGLFRLKKDEYTKIDLPTGKNQPVYSITEGPKGTLFCGLANGFAIIKKYKSAWDVKQITNETGFIKPQCSQNAIEADSRGNIYFGNNDGFTLFKYGHYEHKISIPHIMLKDVQLFRKSILEEINIVEEGEILKLDHSRNTVSFSFMAIDYKSPKSVSYSYILEGLQNKWTEHDPSTFVDFSNLKPGSYAFKVKAIGIDGLYSKTISFPFEINFPFWQKWWFYLICFVIIAIWAFSYYRIRENNKLLNRQKGIILEQKKVVEEKNKEIIDSISYAKRIQSAILPTKTLIQSGLGKHFITYIPRDIVSGDFYWYEEFNGIIYFAAADCTGHGVPGAMVSVLCSNFLTKAVLELNLTKPSEILDQVNELLEKRFESSAEEVNDGMDIALCALDKSKMELQFAGANNPLYLIRNDELEITKGDKQPIGRFFDRKPFENHTVELESGDTIVLFSDGFKDQFGGPKDKKFNLRKFKELLLSINNLPMNERREKTIEAFNSWKGDAEQVDDVCLFSVKI